MKILVVPDTHGGYKYSKILYASIQHQVDIVVFPGDILPLASPLVEVQKQFLQNDFPRFIEKLGRPLFYIMGNDDLAMMDEVALEATHVLPAYNIDVTPVEYENVTFVGMSEVKDAFFEIKDRCRLDLKGDDPLRHLQRGEAWLYISGEAEKWDINHYLTYLTLIPSLEEILDSFEVKDWSKTILVTHVPPHGTGLDLSKYGEVCGSRAVTRFIEKRQPFMTFHGHMHESYDQSGLWNNTILSTICIQPGQRYRELVYVVVDTDTYEMERHTI